MAQRNTTRYHLKKPGGRIVHRGITKRSLEERHAELKQEYGDDTTIVPIGPRVTWESGLDWENEGGKRI